MRVIHFFPHSFLSFVLFLSFRILTIAIQNLSKFKHSKIQDSMIIIFLSFDSTSVLSAETRKLISSVSNNQEIIIIIHLSETLGKERFFCLFLNDDIIHVKRWIIAWATHSIFDYIKVFKVCVQYMIRTRYCVSEQVNKGTLRKDVSMNAKIEKKKKTHENYTTQKVEINCLRYYPYVRIYDKNNFPLETRKKKKKKKKTSDKSQTEAKISKKQLTMCQWNREFQMGTTSTTK